MTPPKKKGKPKGKPKVPKDKIKGRPTIQLASEQIIEVSKKICELYSYGENTIENCCETFDVNVRTFNHWVNSNKESLAEVSEFYKKAKDKSDKVYMDRLKIKCRTALEKLVDGYDTEERHQEIDLVVQKDEAGNPVMGDDGKPIMLQVPKKARIVKKRVGPNVTAAIWGSKNADKEYFRDRYDVDVGGDAVTGLFEFYRNKGKELRGEEMKKK